MSRTLEQKIKFDSGLMVGKTPVTIERKDGSRYTALVEISSRGTVHLIQKPEEGDMYTSWYRIKGNSADIKPGGVVVWAARNPEFLKEFDNPETLISFKY